MDPGLQTVFVVEVLHLGDNVDTAISDVESSIYGDGASIDRFWYSIDAALSSMTRISRVFWPILSHKNGPKIRKLRGEQLRKLVGLGEEPPKTLLAVRNSFEHFDERIDSWHAYARGLARLLSGAHEVCTR